MRNGWDREMPSADELYMEQYSTANHKGCEQRVDIPDGVMKIGKEWRAKWENDEGYTEYEVFKTKREAQKRYNKWLSTRETP